MTTVAIDPVASTCKPMASYVMETRSYSIFNMTNYLFGQVNVVCSCFIGLVCVSAFGRLKRSSHWRKVWLVTKSNRVKCESNNLSKGCSLLQPATACLLRFASQALAGILLMDVAQHLVLCRTRSL